MNKNDINCDYTDLDYPFKIIVNGEEIKESQNIISISVQSEYNKISTAEILVDNILDGFNLKDDEEIHFISEEDIYDVTADIEIWVGYKNPDNCIFKGEIIKKQLSEKCTLLTITAKHKAEGMTQDRKLRSFEKMSDYTIIKNICEEYGITLDLDTPSKSIEHEKIVQYNVSDWDFLNIRAEANGLMVFTTIDGISIKKPNYNQKPKIKATTNDNLIDCKIELDSRHSHKSYTAKAWNYANQGEEETTVSSENTIQSQEAKQTKEETQNVLMMSCQEDSYATETYQEALSIRNDLSCVTGKLTLQGFAPINPNDVILLEKFGAGFNGEIIASEVIQSISADNWETLISIGYDDTPYIERFDNVSAKPSLGTIPGVNGLQIAKVEQLEKDPLGEERIYIRLLNSPDTKIWARIATLDAGKSRGSFFMPEIGDEVIVGFIDDNPNQAVILGMLHSSQSPNPYKITDENHIKGFVSREKLKIQFDDEKKEISIETSEGNKILISDDQKGISMEDQNGNTYILNDQGISIESQKALTIKAAQDISIEGNNISIKANAQLSAQGTSGTEISSSGNTTVKGTMVQIN